MKKRRWGALSLSVLLLLSFSACSDDRGGTVSESGTTAMPVITEPVTEIFEPLTEEETTAVTEPETEPETETSAESTTAEGTMTAAETETVTEETTTERSFLRAVISTLIPTARETTTAPPPPVTKSVRVKSYTKKQLMDYFVVTALHNENGIQLGRVIKWTEPVKIYLIGNYLDRDVEQIQKLCRTLNKIEFFPGISITDEVSDANVFMLFAGSAELSKYIDNFSILDDGYCGFAVDASFRIKKVVIGINSGMVNRKKRDSVISEELLQAMGLPNDSDDYKESVFRRGSDSVSWPADLDWGLAVILYNPGIKPGMNEREARAVMQQFVKS